MLQAAGGDYLLGRQPMDRGNLITLSNKDILIITETIGGLNVAKPKASLSEEMKHSFNRGNFKRQAS